MNNRAITIMEIMVAVIIISLIAVFALPSYERSVRRAHEREAISQLTAIHGANVVYRAQTGGYLTGTDMTIDDINSNLKLNLVSNGMTYAYGIDGGASANAYQATASYPEGSGPYSFVAKVDESAIKYGAGPNPCCAVGYSCPTLLSC